MSYPVGWDLVNVTGTYIGKNGVPCVGYVTFSSPQLVLRSGTIVPASDIIFTLDVNGSFSGQIPATDDPNANPVGWVYTVTENVPGGRQGYQIVAPHTSPGIDLSTVVPVTMPMPPTFGFPYVTLAQLASASPIGGGASLIGFSIPATGAAARTVQAKSQEVWSLLDFGFVLDGVTDNNAAMLALIAACAASGTAKRIYCPPGKAALKGSYTIATPILFFGDGIQYTAYNTIPASYGSTFIYTGTTLSTPFFTLQNFAGGGMQNIAIDCNGLAAEGIDIVAVEHARFDMAIVNYTNWGMRVGYSTTPTNTVTAWNNFGNLYIADNGHAPSGKCALWLTQFASGGSNACHNTFNNVHINHGGTCHGVYLGACDNNHFGLLYTFRNTGAGYGVYVDPTEVSGFPINNTFEHTELSAGWYQPSTTTGMPASIAFYAQDNGEPTPNLGVNGSTLLQCNNITYSYTTSTHTGITGTITSITVFYRQAGNKTDVRVEIAGTSVVVASGATVGGLPTVNGDSQGAAVFYGSQPNTGASTYGYQSGTTMTFQQAVASFTGTLILQWSYI